METTLKNFLENLDINESSPSVRILTTDDDFPHTTEEWLNRLSGVELEETANWQLEDGGDYHKYAIVK